MATGCRERSHPSQCVSDSGSSNCSVAQFCPLVAMLFTIGAASDTADERCGLRPLVRPARRLPGAQPFLEALCHLRQTQRRSWDWIPAVVDAHGKTRWQKRGSRRWPVECREVVHPGRVWARASEVSRKATKPREQKRARALDVVRPGPARRTHVGVECVEQLSGGPGCQLKSGSGRGVADVPGVDSPESDAAGDDGAASFCVARAAGPAQWRRVGVGSL